MIRTTIAICLCVLGLGAPAALAQSPSSAGYGETPNVPSRGAIHQDRGVANYVERNAGTPVHADAGKLPFTGMDVGVLALFAVALLGVGVGLRRSTNSRSAS